MKEPNLVWFVQYILMLLYLIAERRRFNTVHGLALEELKFIHIMQL